MMRVVVVNHMHPSVPHVSGMRAWSFARELAARGHQVILICEWREGAQPAPVVAGLGQQLLSHDWSNPLVLAIQPTSSAVLDRVRSPETATVLRKGLVVWSYVRHSGMFTDFSQAAQPYLIELARTFKPDVAWGILGNTDCWLIAQRLARLAGRGWVGDMKDAWDAWVPFGLRTLLARRFRDMSASTANAEFHAGSLARWFPTRPEVVYSGVDESWIQPSSLPIEGFRVMLVGGVYDGENLARLVRAFSEWVQHLPTAERDRVTFCYAGSDAAKVESAVAELAAHVRVDIRGYVPLSELSGLCRGAAANVYLWSPTTFHHKVVELLCCQRPLVSFPGERAESVELVRRAGGSLNVCRDERQLQDVLSQIREGGLQPAGRPERLQSLTWSSQADRLEAVLQRVATEGPACAH